MDASGRSRRAGSAAPPCRRSGGDEALARALAAATLLLSSTAVVAPGCSRDVDLLQPPGGGDGSVVPADGPLPPLSCQGLGLPVRFVTASGPTCAATIAARAHRTGICSCSDWTVSGPVQITNSASAPGEVTANVGLGVNGALVATNDLTVAGAVYASGAKGVTVGGHVDVDASLRSGGPITFLGPGQATVGGDVYGASDVLGPARITGTLHLPAGALVGAATFPAAVLREPIKVDPPCDCAAPFDVSAAIAAAMAANDDAALNITADGLANVTTATKIDFSCGIYAFSSISSQASLTFGIHGRVLIAVAGDVLLQRALAIAFDPAVPSAELDLLVLGSFIANGGPTVPVGTVYSDLLRVWIAGAGPIVVPSAPVLGGVFHAPGAALMAPRGLTLIGSITAGSLAVAGQVSVDFDDAILEAGTECGDPKVEPLP
ncbi:MAG TPA: hypothetical protein VIU64_17855 [Polyangia bacterium]